MTNTSTLPRKKSKNQKESIALLSSSSGTTTESSASSLFGLPLSADGIDEKCCAFVESCIFFLEQASDQQQGLFRICGSKTDIDELREKANADVFTFTIPEEQEPHSVAGVLKQYFREMSIPLVPFELYSQFVAAATSTEEKRHENIRLCINQLPAINQYILGKLCHFMHKIQLDKQNNLMSAENLSTCMGPNLLRTASYDPKTMIVDSPAVMCLFTILFRDTPLFFTNIERLRPLIKKRGKSLRMDKVNKDTFTIQFTRTEKKSFLIYATASLGVVLNKVCSTRGINVDEFVALDKGGNFVSFDKPIGQIEGKSVLLVSITEFKRAHSSPDCPPFHTEKLKESEKFIFPLPNKVPQIPLTALHEPEPRTTTTEQKRKSGTFGKSFSSSFLPKVWSPRLASPPSLSPREPREDLKSSNPITPRDPSINTLHASSTLSDTFAPSGGSKSARGRPARSSFTASPSRDSTTQEKLEESASRIQRGSSMRTPREFQRLSMKNGAESSRNNKNSENIITPEPIMERGDKGEKGEKANGRLGPPAPLFVVPPPPIQIVESTLREKRLTRVKKNKISDLNRPKKASSNPPLQSSQNNLTLKKQDVKHSQSKRRSTKLLLSLSSNSMNNNACSNNNKENVTPALDDT